MNKHEPDMKTTQSWPELPTLEEWSDTLENLHLWTQIIGKIRLAYMPWINHSWHATLYVSAHGLTTSLVPHENGGFEIEFDFINHGLNIKTVHGKVRQIQLQPMTVADFYHAVKENMNALEIPMDIYEKPVEIPDPILPFSEDQRHKAYDRESVHLFWRVLNDSYRVLTRFRAGFLGKVSPVHFFWGAFDLAVTRFSGRTAPKHPGGAPNCADWVMVEAYSHELSSAGFWPGTGFGEPAFYAYAYPEPVGFRNASPLPKEAFYYEPLGEYIFPYRALRKYNNPDETLLMFLQSTYEAAADYGNWNRKKLER